MAKRSVDHLSPKEIRHYASRIRSFADEWDGIADQMEEAGVHTISVHFIKSLEEDTFAKRLMQHIRSLRRALDMAIARKKIGRTT